MAFKKDQQLIVPLQNQDAGAHFTALKDELTKLPAVRSVTGGSSYPGLANINGMLFYGEGKTVHDVIEISLATPEADFLKTLGLTLLRGREFSRALRPLRLLRRTTDQGDRHP